MAGITPASNMSTNFTKEQLDFARLLKCVQVVGGKTMCDIAKKMYASKRMGTKDGAMTIGTYMRKAKITVNFGDADHLINCNIMQRDFDISFAYKIIKDICAGIYKDLSAHCQDQMTILIKFRNELCHDYALKLDVTKKGKILKEILTSIYGGVAKTLNKGVPKSSKFTFDEEINRMKKSLQDILDAKLRNDVDSNLAEYLKDFMESKMFKVTESAISDLTDFYGKLKVISPCTWTDDDDEENRFKLENVFTPPKLEDNHGEINIAKLLTLTKEIGGRAVIPDTLLIQGEAGAGKTSLCRYLIHSWKENLNEVEELHKFKLVLLVEVRRTTAENLKDYLKDKLMKETFKTFTPKDVLQIFEEFDILFIIDGYDEANKKSRALVKDIFEKFKNKRIIITTRTKFQDEVIDVTKKYNMRCMLVDLKGFDKGSRKVYSQKVFAGMKRDHTGFHRYLDGRGKVLESHLNLPLTVALLIVLWMDDPKNVNNVTTATSLYQELFKLFQKKLQERLIIQHKYVGADELLSKLDSLLLCLGEQAWTMLKEGIDFELQDSLKENIEKECRLAKICETELLTAFLMCEINEDDDDRKPEYFFLHKTQTEYLASSFLAHSIKNGKKLDEIAVEVEDWKNYEQLIVYLTGNMALKDTLKEKESSILDLVSKADISLTNYSYWWSIVSESRINFDLPESPNDPIVYKDLIHPKIGTIIAEQHLFSHTAWRPEFNHVAAALRLISLIPVEVENLNIEIPEDREPFDIPDFLEAIEEVGKHFSEYDSVIKTELILWRHNSHVGERSSDRFLQALVPWAELERFTGSLENVNNLKKNFPQLKNIRCKVTAPEVLKSFKGFRKVRVLRITPYIPPSECSPETLKDLCYRGTLEFCFYNIKDEQTDWVCNVVDNLSKRYGCETLCLENSELSYECIGQLVDRLNGRLHKTLSIRRPTEDDENKQDALEEEATFRIDWY